MLQFTDSAKEKINQLIEGKDSNHTGIMVKISGEHQLDFSLIELDKLAAEEEPLRDPVTNFFVEYDGFMLIVDRTGQKELRDVYVNFEDGGALSGTFEFKKSETGYAKPIDASNPLVQDVQTFLEREINPGLAMHGGRAELINVLDDKVYLKFGGGCQGCSMIDVTVKQGIENRLKEAFPQIIGIIDETDHTSGVNPFFR